MKTLIKLRRNSINRANREAWKYWRGVYITGHFIGGKAVPNRALLTLDERALADGLHIETVINVLGLSRFESATR